MIIIIIIKIIIITIKIIIIVRMSEITVRSLESQEPWQLERTTTCFIDAWTDRELPSA